MSHWKHIDNRLTQWA